MNKDNIGTFDSNGVFRLEPITTSSPVKSPIYTETIGDTTSNFQKMLEKENSIFNAFDRRFSHSENTMFSKPTVDNNWYYCDPSSVIQGPFTANEMQDWYNAGYFDPYLLVKREDSPGFETLANLINRIGDTQNPFRSISSNAARVFPESNHKPSFPAVNDNMFFPNIMPHPAVNKEGNPRHSVLYFVGIHLYIIE